MAAVTAANFIGVRVSGCMYVWSVFESVVGGLPGACIPVPEAFRSMKLGTVVLGPLVPSLRLRG